MVNLEHELTVDDLIVEYMMFKVKNGYEPSFLTSEFIGFLYFFESKMPVEDALYENEKLFTRFFERKAESDWRRTVSWKNEEVVPHMDMVYSQKDNDYLIKANYKLSEYDRSVINTYFMDNGMGKYENYKGKTYEIRQIIGKYLSTQEKTKIDENVEVDSNDLVIGQYVSAKIVESIWDSYTNELMEDNMWPRQCTDINKYLLNTDLAKIIGVKSVKNKLIELYNEFSKRIALLYHQDKNLQISNRSNSYLAAANYELLIQGYEKIMDTTFGTYKKPFDIDLSALTFKESYKTCGIYIPTTNKISNDNVKKLVKNLNKTKL